MELLGGGGGHGGEANCERDHACPNCERAEGPCLDLFHHEACGLVACRAPGRP